MKTFITILVVLAAFAVFLIVGSIGQAVVDIFIPRIVQYAAVFLAVLYVVVYQAVKDGQRR
jgi:hypothetical protein